MLHGYLTSSTPSSNVLADLRVVPVDHADDSAFRRPHEQPSKGEEEHNTQGPRYRKCRRQQFPLGFCDLGIDRIGHKVVER